MNDAPQSEVTTTLQLFLGGSHDGLFLQIDDGAEVVGLSVHKRARSFYRAMQEEDDPHELYTRRKISGGTRTFTLFAIERMGSDEVMAWLIAGYGRIPVATHST